MEGNRIMSENTMGSGNVVLQGNINYTEHNIYEAEASQKQGQEEILRHLYKSPYQDRKDRNLPRVPGTCDWFVSHEHFKRWNDSNSSSMLWVSADPGCGKSVLVRHLIDSVVQSTESRTVCYFFFKDDFPDQRDVTSALCCILRQVFMQKPALLSGKILKKLNAGGEVFNNSFSELWQTLIHIAEDENAGEIVCLLDAVDECGDQGNQGRSELLKALCAFYKTRRHFTLKFLLTSRPYVEIYRGLRPIQIPGLPVIHLSGESENEVKKISQEINIYISVRVENMGRRLNLTQMECKLLLQNLMKVPNRTYLWVYLILDLLEKSININRMMIDEATSNIPTTVDEAYQRILSKSLNIKQAKTILQIIVAAARPLTLQEMSFALSLKEGYQSYDSLDLLPDDRFREDLRNICGLCVVVIDSRVYLLHQTVKEFLVGKEAAQSHQTDGMDHTWKNSLHLQDCHLVLAEICIKHLLAELTMIPDSISWEIWYSIFLDYSAKYWAAHFLESPTKSQNMMNKSVLTICDVDSSCCKAWFRVYWTTTDSKFPDGFTTLMIASYYGLQFAVQSLLDSGNVNINAQDDIYMRSALCWAVKNGFCGVAKLLVRGARRKLWSFELPFRKGPNVDLQDRYGRTPLIYAVWEGDIDLVQLLIRAKAQVHLTDELEGTSLSYAFCNGDSNIIDLLTKKKRDMEIENDINRLLLSAARKDHEEVIFLLLETNRANIEAWDEFHRTPLMLAAIAGHQAIVKLLLEAGAQVNACDKRGVTALMWASQSGHQAIVKLLLESGAEVNAWDNWGMTTLIWACLHGQEAIVKLLLEAGAEVNARDENDKTASTWASEYGYLSTAKLLIEAERIQISTEQIGR